MSHTAYITPIPSATVILLRDVGSSVETLLLRRNSKIAFHGGAWVFPGGRIDPEDHLPGGEALTAARRAAVRESYEEAGLTLAPEDLIWISHWTTPEGRPERYATWFFIAVAKEEEVRIDGEEIHEHRWMRPSHALIAQRAGEIELPPPTFVTLTQLFNHASAASALSYFSSRPAEIFVPRYKPVPGGLCSLYEDDDGYPTVDIDSQGRRHRLWMVNGGWRYERTE